ncbi:MAG: hypothetical protein H7Y89_14030 [Steroidobacteraceae bacterium]|nr:hypothetical protein [Steroidobacteraceae bacterium]
MNHAAGWSLALVISLAADAAEPAGPSQPAKAPRVATVPQAALASSKADLPPAALPAKRLDLRAGKIRDLMSRREMAALLGAPDWEKETIVVEAQRELLPMKFEEPIPGGPMALWWAFKNPSESWRILLPDLNRPDPGPLTMEQKVPQREFRWGP